MTKKTFSNFNGTLIVRVKQDDKDGNTHYFEQRISNFKSLSTNILVGTLTKEIFAIHSARKFAGISGMKSNIPVMLQVLTDENEMILNTAKLDKTFMAKLKLNSEKSFAKALFVAVDWMKHKPQIVEASKILNEKDAVFVEEKGSQILWEKVKEIAQTVTEEPAN